MDMSGWNLVDIWPADVYEAVFDDGAIFITLDVAGYYDDDRTTYHMVLEDGDWKVYWKGNDASDS